MRWAILWGVALVAAGEALPAQSRAILPDGVSGVSFGTARRYKDASGKEMCAIVQPLGDPPVFHRGVMEIAYGVHLRPRAVKSASTQLVAPVTQEALHRIPCNAFTLVKGGFSQTLLGSTISRADKAPLASGKYVLRMTIDGETAEIVFTVR